MNYVLKVTSGADEGRTHRLEPGRACLVGRSPSAAFVLRDETVAWEHANLRVEGNRIQIQNLSALGTRVKGRRVTDEVRVGPNDDIQLSDRCRLVVEPAAGGRGGLSPVAGLAIAVLVLVVVGGLSALLLLREPEAQRRPITDAHWRTAYNRIETRLERWRDRGEFPPEGLLLYRDGWRLEQANNPEAALEKWNELRAMLLRSPLPGSNEDGRTIAEMAGPGPKTLGIVMGWDLSSDSTFQSDSDETFADALVWFVRQRCKRLAEAGQPEG